MHIKKKMNGIIYGDILGIKNPLKMEHGWNFQRDSDPQLTAWVTGRLRKKHFKVLRWSK